MNKVISLFLFLFCSSILFTQEQAKPLYHLGAFVRLQGHPNFTVSLSQFKKMMNDTCENSFSFKSFLKASSYNKLDYNFVTIERNNIDTIPYYYDIMPVGYYSPKSDKNPHGFDNDAEARSRVHELTNRYISFLNDNLPEDVKLDGNGDGKVDVLTYIAPTLQYPFSIRTYGGNWAGGIPHNNPNNIRIKGFGVGSFSVNIADSWNNPQANGIFKHEVGHNLKTWDYYDSNNNPSQRFMYRNLVSDPAGAWNMMTGASNTYGAYVIWSRLGFLTNDDVKILNTSGTYRLNSLFSNSLQNVCYKIQSPNSDTEYFILEYRSKHKAFEWWHNAEGLVVTLVNPHVRGNPRGANNPRAFELFYLRDKENNVTFRNTTLNQHSSPKLALSNGKPAGFSIENIRIENNQLVFNLAFDDQQPYIRAVEYPEIVSKDAHEFTWQVEVNPGNMKKWKAKSNEEWLNFKYDFKSAQLKISVTKNKTNRQRNAIIELIAPGAKTRKAYFVQRANTNEPVLWMPEISSSNTYVIEGEESSCNFRIIGDLDGSWWGGNSQITNGRGERQVLHNSINSVYAYRNSTNEDKEADIKFRLINGKEVSFKVIQKPAKTEPPVYSSNVGFLPVNNDKKWYFIRTESGRCTNSNFLKVFKSGNSFGVSTGFPMYNDSLLWTLDSDAAGKVLLRNKALGYLCEDAINGQFSFSSLKPNNGFKTDVAVSRNLYYGAQGLSFSFISDPKNGLFVDVNGDLISKRTKPTDNAIFFFELPNSNFLKQLANNLIFSFEGNDTFNMKTELENLKSLVYSINDNQNKKIFENNARLILVEMNRIFNSINNYFEVKQFSQSSWFVVKRYIQATWGLHLEQQTDEYLYFSNRFSDLSNNPIDLDDIRYAFQFLKHSEGKYVIYNRAYPNEKLYVHNDKIILSGNNMSIFELVPIVTFRGLKFAIVDSQSGKYLTFDRRTLNLKLVDRPSLSNLVNASSYLFELSTF